jgi:transposase-like protein
MSKKHSPEFKFKVAMAGLRTQDSTAVATQYSVAYSLVHKWCKILEKQGHLAFGITNDKEKEIMKKELLSWNKCLARKKLILIY